MRWYRLTEEERRILRAPAEVDGFGMLVLTLFDTWQRDAVFVLVKAFVDETGTGGEKRQRLMLACLVQIAHKWHRFNNRWNALLKESDAPFFHLVDMQNRKPPFEDWGGKRTQKFVLAALPLIEDDIAFGATMSLDYRTYREEFRDKLHPKAHRDSAYGVCSRALIEAMTLQCRTFWGSDTVVNFVFERSDHFAEAERNFHNAKHHIYELTPHLGKIAPGEKDEFCGLQAADLQACLRGRIEHVAPFEKVERPFETLAQVRKSVGGCPIYRYDLGPDQLRELREQTESISREKKWGKRKRGFERQRERNG